MYILDSKTKDQPSGEDFFLRCVLASLKGRVRWTVRRSIRPSACPSVRPSVCQLVGYDFFRTAIAAIHSFSKK